MTADYEVNIKPTVHAILIHISSVLFQFGIWPHLLLLWDPSPKFFNIYIHIGVVCEHIWYSA